MQFLVVKLLLDISSSLERFSGKKICDTYLQLVMEMESLDGAFMETKIFQVT